MAIAEVTIAGGTVSGEYEQVKAVQKLIIENEELRAEVKKMQTERIEAGLIDEPESSAQWMPEVDSIVKIRKDLELDSRIVDFAGMDVVVTSTFFVDGRACFSFSHEWQGLGSATVNAISIKAPEQKARDAFKEWYLFPKTAEPMWEQIFNHMSQSGVDLTPLIKEQTK